MLSTFLTSVARITVLIQLNKNLKVITDIEEKMEKLKELLMIANMVVQDVESCPFTDDVVENLLSCGELVEEAQVFGLQSRGCCGLL